MNASCRENNGWEQRSRILENNEPDGCSPESRNEGHRQPHPSAFIESYSSMGRDDHHSRQKRRRSQIDRHHYGPERLGGDYRRPSAHDRASMQLCRFFIRGYCRDDTSCRFRHENPHSTSDYYGRSNGNRVASIDRHIDSTYASLADSTYASLAKSGYSDRHQMSTVSSQKNDARSVSTGVNESERQMINNISVPDSESAIAEGDKFGPKLTQTADDKEHQPRLDDKSTAWRKVNKVENKPPSNSSDVPSLKESSIRWGSNQTLKPRELNHCNKPGHDHLWKECPDNKYSKNYKPPPPKLTATESNALCRAAFSNAISSSQKNTQQRSMTSVIGTSDKHCAPQPTNHAKSINSLHGSASLKNKTLRQPPTVMISKTSASASGKAAASLAGAIPRRNLTVAQRKSSLLNDANPACHLTIPTSEIAHKKTFVPRSQRAMAKRPSSDQPSCTSKKRKLSNSNSHVFQKSLAPSGDDAIAIAKYTTTRMLNNVNKSYGMLARDESSRKDKISGAHEDNKTNDDFDRDAENTANSPAKSSLSNKTQELSRAKSPEVICLDSFSDKSSPSPSSSDQDDVVVNKFLDASKSADMDTGIEKLDDVDTYKPTSHGSLSHEVSSDDGQNDTNIVRDQIDQHMPPSNTLSDEVKTDQLRLHDANESVSFGIEKEQSTSSEGARLDFHLPLHVEETRIHIVEQRQVLFTDDQIDEMENDLLDWLEECCTKTASQALCTEQTSMSDEPYPDEGYVEPKTLLSLEGNHISPPQPELEFHHNTHPNARSKSLKELWNMNYEAVKKFQRENGHLKLPNELTAELGNLHEWLRIQKHKLRNDTLKLSREKKIKKLLRTKITDRKADKDLSDQFADINGKVIGTKKLWRKKFKAVENFFKETGHLNLPDKKLAEVGNLYKWFKIQKSKLKNGSLTIQQTLKLNDLIGHEDVRVMKSIDHLSSTDLSSGFPKQSLVVIDNVTESLYYFQTEVRSSGIINSGRGVFLTYLGAKVLKPDALARSKKLKDKHVEIEDLVRNPLPAIDHTGKRMTVTITPKSVHLNENNHLWTTKRFLAYDKNIKKNPDQDFNLDVDCNIHDEVRALRASIPEHERIGNLGINSIHDYIDEESNTPFWSHNHIELGRYGPFRPKDRKPELHFNMKNFLFDYAPNEWACGIHGEEGTIIDITDDSSGEIHSIAKQHSAIYVNEVGHLPDLHENVYIRDNGEAGAVYYYISVDEKHSMKRGDTVELLANYGESYEEVRERKGYGLVNRKERIGGDSENKSAKFRRNFVERSQVELELLDLNFDQLWSLAKFLTEEIYQPLAKAMDGSLANYRHLIARRRLHWLSERFERRLRVLLQEQKSLITRSSTDTLREWIHEWKFNYKKVDSTRLMEEGGQSLKDALRAEMSEEVLYEASYQNALSNPMDTCTWSHLAIKLMCKCAETIASYYFTRSGPNPSLESKINEIILQTAFESSQYVRRFATWINRREDVTIEQYSKAISALSLQSRHKHVGMNQGDSHDEHFVWGLNAVIPYADAAARAEMQAYRDAVDLCFESNFMLEPVTASDSDIAIIISEYCSDQERQTIDRNDSQLFWIPRTVNAFKRGFARVNVEWYLLHHVVLVVHALASTVDWTNPIDDTQLSYSLEKLCAKVGISRKNVDAVISHNQTKSVLSKPSRSPQNVRKSLVAKQSSRRSRISKSRTGKSIKKSKLNTKDKAAKISASKKYLSTNERVLSDEPDINFPGWNVRRITRITNKHRVDKYWYRPEHSDIVVRSVTGLNHITQTMKEENIDFCAACAHLVRIGKGTYFCSGRNKAQKHQPER